MTEAFSVDPIQPKQYLVLRPTNIFLNWSQFVQEQPTPRFQVSVTHLFPFPTGKAVRVIGRGGIVASFIPPFHRALKISSVNLRLARAVPSPEWRGVR
jgi:hypothetical protein